LGERGEERRVGKGFGESDPEPRWQEFDARAFIVIYRGFHPHLVLPVVLRALFFFCHQITALATTGGTVASTCRDGELLERIGRVLLEQVFWIFIYFFSRDHDAVVYVQVSSYFKESTPSSESASGRVYTGTYTPFQ
jgi:hypothetical protein